MIPIATWELPIYLFYSDADDRDGQECIRVRADLHREAQLAACKLDWLEYNLEPSDYQIITRKIRHSDREHKWEGLEQRVAAIYGDTDPYVYLVFIGFDDEHARFLYEQAFKNVR